MAISKEDCERELQASKDRLEDMGVEVSQERIIIDLTEEVAFLRNMLQSQWTKK